MSSVEIRPVSGIAVEPWLDELAGLRIRVFRDYPYLYDGDPDYERRYLDRYARSDRSLFVLALEYNRVVGVASALPLEDADEEFLVPFQQRGPRRSRSIISVSRCCCLNIEARGSAIAFSICVSCTPVISASPPLPSVAWFGPRMTLASREDTPAWNRSGAAAGTVRRRD